MISAARKFANSTPFFELAEHFQQGMTVGSLEVEAATDIVERGWIRANLQKTQDVVWPQVRGTRHGLGPVGKFGGRGGFYSLFFAGRETFFKRVGLHTKA